MAYYTIDRYELMMWSSRSLIDNPNSAIAGLMFYEAGTGRYRGRAYFHPDGINLPAPTESGGFITLRYNLCQLESVIDLLRNEKPIYLYFYSAGNAGLKTGREPVGEEEEDGS